MGRELGIDEATLADLHNYRDSDRFTELERLAIDLAVAMTDTPTHVSDELRAALRQHLTAGQLTELVSAIAWENHRGRVNRALDVRAVGFADGAFCLLPERPSGSVDA